ncbi:hypothetical protein RP20_CCG005487 [Aedes albopictus]|nr:hypothetical protein RP20_CCG005487 [Aedes albopictus]
MQALRSRTRRSTELVGDLNLFKTKDQAYLKFIDSLVTRFSDPNVKFGQIKVTKKDDGITKVTIKDSSTSTQVGFIYRNRDLYIVGLLVDTTFYIEGDAYKKAKAETLNSWKSAIGAKNMVDVSSFTYANILPYGENTNFELSKLGESLTQLVQIGDTKKRKDIVETHLSPFVVAFAEAIRFPVVKREVQDMIRKPPGTFLKLSKNIIPMLSLGHPDERTSKQVFSIYSLLLIWGKLSDRVPALYGDPPQNLPAIGKKGDFPLHLDKVQLSTLLGVANSNSLKHLPVAPTRRAKRDISSTFVSSLRHTPTLLEHHIDYIDYDGKLQQKHQSPSAGATSITHTPDVIGALHLLAVGMLYLTRKKLNIPLGNAEYYRDPRDALVVAVDITDRIRCFLKSAAFELDVGFEEEVELQRQIARALIRGDSVESVYSAFLEQHYFDAKGYNDTLETLQKQLIEALASEKGSIQEKDYPGNECFK